MRKWYAILYECALAIAGVLALPWLFYQVVFKQKYRKSFWKRLGFGFPHIQKGQRPVIWMHAVSVGETKAIAGLAKLFKERFSNPILVISSITEMGHEEAKRSLPFADHHVYLPFDFSWIIRPIVKKISPDIMVVSETDFWFNFLHQAKQLGAFLALVNGKLSERSLKRYQRLRAFPLFSLFDLFCVQNRQYQNRFSALNIPTAKLAVTGNLKCGSMQPYLSEEEMVVWRNKLSLTAQDLVLTLGSTHEPEEQQVLERLQPLLHKFPKLKILLVPRHPERCPQVAQLLHQLEIPYARYSQASFNPCARVVLVDAMGVLLKCYQLSHLAVVAGSFTEKVGGHHILEPSYYKVPVLFGPYMHSQREFEALCLERGAGLQVNLETIAQTVERLLGQADLRQNMGEKGFRLMLELQGAHEMTFNLLQEQLKASER
ncbi:3-deoxy-D-manno-octulosonic acid transferase [Parachlamydia sp. AcF125]|uniref:3-deoxy-D-manno-octulosonic acid transferase n=1 Tax=Parachlamydia sp. AcF125 TaxID=2795736 RepID=UPI001BC989F1|nr:3-deoxy-D-manno-octulosonic acid transferase [Parachlamydia sp. AcF125]MBS4168432.1 3-deoxy-D-manno-octulosonic acid transferase [Parachlamydia sp. AcF125]